ncbi:ankyrin repeat domain-containing protein [Cardinium endosymbiont of Nabis limbatus]|uniref:ankyrin repeat domain-containing protein n=1 Tax=Cardinium endosymbiont of Nabis limbatus TaxID=3066217 RepID=UPI003AF3B49F
MPGGHIEIIKLLLEHRAKIDETDECGCTSLHYVSSIGNKNIPEPFIAKDVSKTAIAELLIAKGASKTAENKEPVNYFV